LNDLQQQVWEEARTRTPSPSLTLAPHSLVTFPFPKLFEFAQKSEGETPLPTQCKVSD